MMRAMRRVTLGSLVLATSLALAPSIARADDKAAAAEALFNEGQKLFNDGAINAACEKLQESYNLDPAMGALLVLAACHEKQGKTASAWSEFKTLESQAQRAGRKDREEFARDAVARLEPKLRKLAVRVKVPVEGLEVKRNGVPVGKAQWGLPIPVDPGAIKVEAAAPGKKPFTGSIDVQPGPGLTELEVPALADAPVEKPGPGPDPGPGGEAKGGFGAGRIAGLAMAGVGLVGAGVGVGFHVAALKADSRQKDDFATAEKNKESTTCDTSAANTTPFRCAADSEGKAKRTNQTTAFVLYGVGGALLIGGVVMFLVLPSGGEKKADARPMILPQVGQDGGGLSVVGRF